MLNHDVLDLIIKLVALLGAGLFFLYKADSGFNNLNLSLFVDTSRSHPGDESSGLDIVHCKITIEKGMIAALALEGLEARFVWGQKENEKTQVQIEICRLKIQPSSDPTEPKVSWCRDEDRPYLYLSPGEKTSFECMALVPRNVICKVDVVAFGRRKVAARSARKWWPRRTFPAQWRASAVVLGLQK